MDNDIFLKDLNEPSLAKHVEQLQGEATERAARSAARNKDLIIACMYIDFCHKQHFNVYDQVDKLRINVDENDHEHVMWGDYKLGELWPPAFEEKRDEEQDYIVSHIRYEPFAHYHKDDQMMEKAEEFLRSFRHLINSG